MELDLVQSCLLLLLGALLAYILDEVFRLTPRFNNWFDRDDG